MREIAHVLLAWVIGLALLSCVAPICAANADPITFSVEPGGTASNDDAWKAAGLALATGNYHAEEDFESYVRGGQVDSLSLGGVTVAISTNGSVGAEIFYSSYFTSLPAGTINFNSLLNYTDSRKAMGPVTFTFTGDAVQGFGIWIYDDDWYGADTSSMTVETMDGTIATSAYLDGNPGSRNMQVEGFLGVRTTGALKSVTITNFRGTCFEMDHLQIIANPTSSVPEPCTLALVGLGVTGVLVRQRRRSRS